MSSAKRRQAVDSQDAAHQARRRRANSGEAETNTPENGNSPVRGASTDDDALVKKVVRLALSSEVARKPLRRQEIMLALGPAASRRFKPVMKMANETLKRVFGYELNELPQKEKVTTAEKRAAQRSGAAATQENRGASDISAVGSGNWILVNTLSPKYRLPTVIHPSRIPSAQAESSYMGLVAFVLATIALSGEQRLSSGKMESFLASADDRFTEFGDSANAKLKRLEKDGYIRKIREEEGGEVLIDYMIGPRGRTEIGSEGIAGFIRKVFRKDGQDLVALEDAMERSLGARSFKRTTAQGQAHRISDDTADEMDGN